MYGNKRIIINYHLWDTTVLLVSSWFEFRVTVLTRCKGWDCGRRRNSVYWLRC